MKSLSETVLSALEDRAALDIVWVAEIEPPGGEALRLATRPLLVAGVRWRARLLEIESLVFETRRRDGVEVGGDEQARLRIARPHPATVPFRRSKTETPISESALDAALVEALETAALAAPIRLGFIALPRDPATPLDDSAFVTLFRGRIETVEAQASAFRVGACGLGRRLARPASPPLEPALLALHGMDPRSALVPPLVFGRVAHCPLLPWRLRRRAQLTQKAEYDDTWMCVDSVEGWPPAGRAQIGDETFEYSELDPAAATLGTPASPLFRPQARVHRLGAPIWWLPDGAFPEWMVAGHRCESVTNLRAADRPLEPGVNPTVVVHTPGPDLGPEHTTPTLTLVRCERVPWVLEHATEPTRRCPDPEEIAVAVASENTAEDPAAAFDGDRASFARLHTEAERLALAVGRNLARETTPGVRVGDRRYGRFHSLVVELELGADRLWSSASRVDLVVHAGGQVHARTVARPQDDEYQSYPGDFTIYPPLVTAPTSMPPRLTTFDISEWIGSLGGWGVFAAPAAAPRFEVVFTPVADDPAVVRVYALRLEFGWRAPTRCETVADLTATVEGWTKQPGAFSDSPVAVLRALLTAPHFGRVPASELQEPEWAAVEDAMQQRDARVRRRIAHPATVRQIADSLAAETGLVVVREPRGWRLRLLVPSPAAPETADAALAPSDRVDLGPVRRVAPEALRNDVEVYVSRPHPGATDDERLARVVAEYSVAAPWGRRRARVLARWLGVGAADRAAAVRLASTRVERAARPWRTLEIEVPLARAAVERGDVLLLDPGDPFRLAGPVAGGGDWNHAETGMPDGEGGAAMDSGGCPGLLAPRRAPTLGEVETVRLGPRAATLVLGLRLAPPTSVVWDAPGTEARIENTDDGLELAFVVRGRRVASLTRDGLWRIAGWLELGAAVEAPATGCFEWVPDEDGGGGDGGEGGGVDGGVVRFAAGPPEDLRVVATLDADGNLRVAGLVAEAMVAEPVAPPSAVALREGRLLLCPARRVAAARFLPEEGELQLARGIQEYADL